MSLKYINDIIENLKSINPEKIILFGSYANGNPSEDSDIDLIVVTNDTTFPQNYAEKKEIHLKVAQQLSEIMSKIPIDLIVYTKPMFKKFIELNSMFSKEITQYGKTLYENSN
jgi:predicted nucleotidyltransferase